MKHLKGRKYTYENLYRFTTLSEDHMTPALRSARTRARNTGDGFYGLLTQEFPTHYRSFRNMQEVRHLYAVSPQFTKNAIGFVNFILSMGPLPNGTQDWIVVRQDPQFGFMPWNLKWELRTRFDRVNALRAASFR